MVEGADMGKRVQQQYILVIDEGTTGVRAIIYDMHSREKGKSYRGLEVNCPKPGWVEQDAETIWSETCAVVREALKRAELGAKDIAGIGITNQRMTNVIWDRDTGRPVAPSLTWQDSRAGALAKRLNQLPKIRLLRALGKILVTISKLVPPLRHSRRGKFFITLSNLRFSPLYMGVQLRYQLDTIEGLRARAIAGEVLAGTIDSWLIWKLTGGAVHATDYSNVSATYLYDPYKLDWSGTLLDILDVPTAMLPEVRASSDDYGMTTAELFGSPIPICGVIADQQSALFGETCFLPGDVKCTNGTGTFIDMNVGTEPIASTHGLVPLVAWKIGDEVNYAIEGYINTTGSAVQWLHENAGLIASPAESETLALSVDDTDDVYFVPAFTGLSSPFWDHRARGTVIGLTRGTTRAHMVRAALEAIGYRCRDILLAMADDTGLSPRRIRADGGASLNDFILQFIADLLEAEVERPANLESTALGAAYMAGLYCGYWRSKEEIAELRRVDRIFKPQMGAERRERLYSRWKTAVGRSGCWAQEETESR